MTKTQHTWYVSEETNDCGEIIIFDSTGDEIAICSGINKEANARLIAAAPELLEACIAVDKSITLDEIHAARDLIVFAIAKAKG